MTENVRPHLSYTRTLYVCNVLRINYNCYKCGLWFCIVGDDVSRAVMNYAENESHNPSTKIALSQFAENFSGVQDYREAEVITS